MIKYVFSLLALQFFVATSTAQKNQKGNGSSAVNKEFRADVVIYGGTAAAVIAAVKVKQLGKSVIVISPDKHLGGVTSSGLGYSDVSNKDLIGGLAKDFYRRVYDYYQKPESWKWQSKSDYGSKGISSNTSGKGEKFMWIFEPHVAEKIFDDWIDEYKIQVLKEEYLDRNRAVGKDKVNLNYFYTLSGKKIIGKVFIDATYEGDLMASSGVRYTFGREANSVYGEKHNGIVKGVYQHDHNFKKLVIDPYVIKGKPESGLIPKISPDSPGKNGDGDNRIEAYCYRMCLTKVKENQIPITKPANYNPSDYELLGRIFEAGWNSPFNKFDPVPNNKTDVNNHGPFSFDNIGMNYDYPEASYERRREIAKEHENYQKGLLYFIATDLRVPEKTREEMNKWGYAKDEFLDNGGFPHQLYVREARRMIGSFVMTEKEIMDEQEIPNAIGMGSYNLDSHNAQRYVTEKGHVENEGDIGIKPPAPYKIPLGAIVPKEDECSNLIVPVCVSSTHIVYGSIRMEPVFMKLSESAAQIACLAIDSKKAVQKVDYPTLQKLLLQAGQVLENPTKEKSKLMHFLDLNSWHIKF
jgi:FAD dependent oxidoreductase